MTKNLPNGELNNNNNLNTTNTNTNTNTNNVNIINNNNTKSNINDNTSLLGPKDKNNSLSVIRNNKSIIYNILIVFLVLFLSETARGLVLPSTPSYVESVGGDSSFLGIVISSFSLGRFISTILLGYLSSKLKYKKVFIGSVFICIVGSFIYCFAYLNNGSAGKAILIISRLLLGFGAGTLSAVRAYIAEVTKPSERTTYIAYLSVIQFFGFAVTPILGSSLQYLPTIDIISPFSINDLTSAGWFLTIFNLVLFFILIFQFSNPSTKDQTANDDEKQLVKPTPLPIPTDNGSVTNSNNDDQKSLFKLLIQDKKVLKNLIIFIILNFFVRGILGVFETIGVSIYNNLMVGDENDYTSGYYFGVMGCIGIVILLGISYISKKQLVDDIWILITGNVFVLIACSVCISSNLGWAKFTIGSALIFGVGYPCAQTVIVSMFSKQLSSSLGKKSQGSIMGIIGAAGSLGRICGPLISGLIFDADTLNTINVFWFATSLAIVTLIVSCLLIPRSTISVLKLKSNTTFNSFIRLNNDDSSDEETDNGRDESKIIKDENYYKL